LRGENEVLSAVIKGRAAATAKLEESISRLKVGPFMDACIRLWMFADRRLDAPKQQIHAGIYLWTRVFPFMQEDDRGAAVRIERKYTHPLMYACIH
jgi:hypothetical protein